MMLSFKLPQPSSMERVRAIVEKLASTLTGWAVSLKLKERKNESDVNGADACHVSTWIDGPITLSESVLSADGNPRDGYGYKIALELNLPSHRLTIGSFEWEPALASMPIDVNCSGREWLKLREVLRVELGAANDQTAVPWMIMSALEALSREGEREAAIALAKECLASVKPTESRREEVVAWLAANDSTAGGAAMRVKEAPAQLEGWLELERSGDSTLAEVFARLCPFDRKRWSAPAPWFAHPAWPFERAPGEAQWKTVHLRAGYVEQSVPVKLGEALTGFESGWQDVEGERLPGVDGWQWSVSRRALWPLDASTPIIHVTLRGQRRAPEEWSLPLEKQFALDYRETQRWSWINGAQSGDVVSFVERSLLRPDRGLTQTGVAFSVLGSDEFRARAEAAIVRLTHVRWHPVSANESLEAWPIPAPVFADAVGAMKAALSPHEAARGVELMNCGCAAGTYCEHRLELSRNADANRGFTPTSRARSAAWGAAFDSVMKNFSLEWKLREVHENLLLVPEYVD